MHKPMKFDHSKIGGILAALATLIGAICVAFGLQSCGVTKAYIRQPRDNSQTTITITTNNPISTEVSSPVDADVLNKPSN